MPSPFDVTVASNLVSLDNKREGVATFTVHNNTRRRLRAAARVTTTPADGAGWVTILPPENGSVTGGTTRDFPIDSTQQYQVKIAVPMDAPPGSYTLKLVVADEVNPDDNFTESPEVQFTVREIPKEAPKPLPGWLIPAIIIAVLVIVALVVGVVVLSNQPEPTPTPTPEPTATVALGPCTITMTNAQFTYQQPDTISNTLFDQVQAGTQWIATGRSADNGWWSVEQYGVNVWLQTSLLTTTADVTGDCGSLPAVCLLAMNADADVYTKPSQANVYTQAHAGWQFVPTGKLADDSWWQFSYNGQETWIPANIFGTRATPSGDCASLPVVSAPA